MRNMISSSPLWARWRLFLDAARSSYQVWTVGILFLRKSAKGGIVIGIRLSVCIWTCRLHETYTSCYGLSPSSESQGELTMADAIIFRRRGGEAPAEYTPPNLSGGTQSNTGNWWTAIFTSNGWFKAGDAKSSQYSVLIFGGGGKGCISPVGKCWMGGGGGVMNKSTLTLSKNTNISITIGAGQTVHSWGAIAGTTSFGTYLSAIGGECGDAEYHHDNGELFPDAGMGGSGGGSYTTARVDYSWGGGVGNQVYRNYSGAYWSSQPLNFGSGGFYCSTGVGVNATPPITALAGPYGGSGGIYGSSNGIIGVKHSNSNLLWMSTGTKSTYGGTGSTGGSGSAGTSCSNSGWRYPNGTWMNGTSSGGSYGGGGGGYGSQGGSYGGGGGGWCAAGGWYGGGGGGYGINGYGGNNGGGGGAYGRGGGPGGAPLYGGGGWGQTNQSGANGIVIIQWYSN